MLTASEAKRIAILSRNKTEIEATYKFVMDKIYKAAKSGGTCINWMFDQCPVCATADIRNIVRQRLVDELEYRVDSSTESVRWD